MLCEPPPHGAAHQCPLSLAGGFQGEGQSRLPRDAGIPVKPKGQSTVPHGYFLEQLPAKLPPIYDVKALATLAGNFSGNCSECKCLLSSLVPGCLCKISFSLPAWNRVTTIAGALK